MLVFRLFRIGKNNQPSFKVVVTDKKNPARGGRFVEQVGTYNPVTKEKTLNKERVQYWLKQGVKAAGTLYNLFIKEGILEGKKIAMHKKSKKPVAEAKPAEAKPQPVETTPQPKIEEPKKEETPKPAEKPAEAQAAPAPKTE